MNATLKPGTACPNGDGKLRSVGGYLVCGACRTSWTPNGVKVGASATPPAETVTETETEKPKPKRKKST